eukprot:m.212856 g.212856  ORF g.212856 m.212856 type:complete len:85 (+) comp10141_c6_seq48:709-963(+)
MLVVGSANVTGTDLVDSTALTTSCDNSFVYANTDGTPNTVVRSCWVRDFSQNYTYCYYNVTVRDCEAPVFCKLLARSHITSHRP